MASGIRWSLKGSAPAQGTAATVQSTTLGTAPRAGILAVASLIPNADVAGHASNARLFSVINKGSTGNGTASMATWNTDSDTVGQGSLVDFDVHSMAISAVTADITVAAGDVIALVETVAASGVAHAGARVELAFDPT